MIGTGGTPPTLQGYIKIRKFGLRRLLAWDDLRDPSPLSDEGPRYLEIAIPPREGGHPNLTHWYVSGNWFLKKKKKKLQGTNGVI